MDVNIRGHNLRINDSLDDFAQKKLDKLGRYLPNISEIKLDLSRKKTKRGSNQVVAQLTVRHARGAILRTEERIEGDDPDSFQAAINLSIDKMYRQIERFKGKRRKSKRREKDYRFIATEEELDEAENVPNYEALAAEYEEESPEVVRRKEIAIEAMTEQDAIVQMELLMHPFYMFKNAETGEVNVLYRRDSGGYGVLVPDA